MSKEISSFIYEPIIKLKPCLKDFLWGGTRMIGLFHQENKMKRIAEAWIVSAHPDGESIVDSGVYKGKCFSEYLNIIGNSSYGKKGKNFLFFPLIIKFIDADKDLSIQVHPSGVKKDPCTGLVLEKNEQWFILDTKSPSKLMIGFNRDTDKKEVLDLIRKNKIIDLVKVFETHKGDIFYIKSSTIHAICSGNFICEVQQSSNCTYRIYDYDRVDEFGNKRPIHINESISNLNYKKFSDDDLINPCDKFKSLLLKIENSTLDLEDSSFACLVCLNGKGQISIDDFFLEMNSGDSFFIPAQNNKLKFHGDFEILFVTL